jgi:hypothetical protein
METSGSSAASTEQQSSSPRQTFLDKMIHFVDTQKSHCPVYAGFRGIGRGELSTK